MLPTESGKIFPENWFSPTFLISFCFSSPQGLKFPTQKKSINNFPLSKISVVQLFLLHEVFKLSYTFFKLWLRFMSEYIFKKILRRKFFYLFHSILVVCNWLKLKFYFHISLIITIITIKFVRLIKMIINWNYNLIFIRFIKYSIEFTNYEQNSENIHQWQITTKFRRSCLTWI